MGEMPRETQGRDTVGGTVRDTQWEIHGGRRTCLRRSMSPWSAMRVSSAELGAPATPAPSSYTTSAVGAAAAAAAAACERERETLRRQPGFAPSHEGHSRGECGRDVESGCLMMMIAKQCNRDDLCGHQGQCA
jgi:hypothetical protein